MRPSAIYWDLYRHTRQSPGSVIAKAIAGIENALLDVKAKALGVPVYELFGGPTRETIPVYWSHCGTTRARAWEVTGTSKLASYEDVVALGREVVERGFPAFKTNIVVPGDEPQVLMPGFGEGGGTLRAEEIADALVRLLKAFGEGTGDRARPIVDLNFNLEPEGLVRVARALEPFDLLWLEVDLFDPAALAHVRHVAPMPICSGENLYGSRGFRPFLEAGGMDVASVDVIWNGFHQAKKIADLAETFEVNCAPHNYYSHLATFIAAQWCAAIPNARILEFDVDDVPWRDELVTATPEIVDGELADSRGAGMGSRRAGGRRYARTRGGQARQPDRLLCLPERGHGAEAPLESFREQPVPPAQLQPRQLRRLVDDCVGEPTALPGPPEPLQLAARVSSTGPAERGGRLAALADVRPLGGRAGVEEPPERSGDRVRVRVEHGRRRLVGDRPAREQHAARPLLILAHHEVVREAVRVPHAPWHCGVDIREERRFEGQVFGLRDSLAACRRSVEKVEKVALGRTGVRVRELPAVHPGDGVVRAEGRRQRRQPAVVGRVRVLGGEDEDVAAGELGPEVARAAVVELPGRDRMHAGPELAGAVRAAVGRARVDDDDLDLLVHLLPRDPLEAADETGAAVLDRDHDRDHRDEGTGISRRSCPGGAAW